MTTGAVLYIGSNATPRCGPSAYGQTGTSLSPCVILPWSGSEAYDVGTPRVTSPRSGGKTYFSLYTKELFASNKLQAIHPLWPLE